MNCYSHSAQVLLAAVGTETQMPKSRALLWGEGLFSTGMAWPLGRGGPILAGSPQTCTSCPIGLSARGECELEKRLI